MLKYSKKGDKKGVNLQLESRVEGCGEGLDEKWLLRESAPFGAFVASWQRNNPFPHKHNHYSECHCSESVQPAASGSDDIFDIN